MDDPGHMRVIEIETVAQVAIQDGRVARRKTRRVADHGHVALSAESSHRIQNPMRMIVSRSGHGDAGGIEHVMQRTEPNSRRNVVGLRFGRKSREHVSDSQRLRYLLDCFGVGEIG
jgi:hypothetical protein